MDQLHVLVVDDNIVNRMLVKRLLLKSSCTVTAVDCGGKALQVLGLDKDNNENNTTLKVDLIITDYSMPIMTGFELLKKIKSSETHRQIPMVIMSSENIEARILRCLEEGAQEFILKPVKIEDITRLKNSIVRYRLPAEQQPITCLSNESTSQVVCESSSINVTGEGLSVAEEV